jgi:hypothetical protein
MDTSLFPHTQDSSTGLPTYAYWTSPLSPNWITTHSSPPPPPH